MGLICIFHTKKENPENGALFRLSKNLYNEKGRPPYPYQSAKSRDQCVAFCTSQGRGAPLVRWPDGHTFFGPVSGRPYFLCFSAYNRPGAGAQCGSGGSPPAPEHLGLATHIAWESFGSGDTPQKRNENNMKILAIETSCDETAAAVSQDGRTILSDVIYSQADMHALYGGVVPEIASRKHVQAIAALTDKALADAGLAKKDIDAVAVTYAPGLIGAVLVGVSFAKSAAYALGVPLIPVHHVRGHIAANYLAFPELEPPFVALAISGGNTLIVDVADYTDMTVLGATRDDAAGECFDKAARVLGLPYPGGRPMDQLAQQSAGGVYDLPSAHVAGSELDMSFSGLKTAVVNLAHNAQQKGDPLDAPALARDFARAVSGELVPRAMRALELTGRRTLVAAGGVAANSVIRADLHAACGKAGVRLFLPPLKWCGDNGAMIGAQGYYEYQAGRTAGLDLNAYATMDLGAPLL